MNKTWLMIVALFVGVIEERSVMGDPVNRKIEIVFDSPFVLDAKWEGAQWTHWCETASFPRVQLKLAHKVIFDDRLGCKGHQKSHLYFGSVTAPMESGSAILELVIDDLKLHETQKIDLVRGEYLSLRFDPGARAVTFNQLKARPGYK